MVSGIPSTAHALLTGRDVLAATRAAGTLLPGRRTRPGVAAGLIAHVVVSAAWTGVLAAIARHHRLRAGGGAIAGLAIAALDLGIAARAYPAVRALPRGPQILDHLVFGAVTGALLDRPVWTDQGTTSTTSPGCSEL
ncbi:hypothetical protein AMES_5837 [Amycolatopsis mediterranei S699]|uniref:Uncharacterized protein n=1 Tax=Amycolatopsis mediterranei (strain S699) TaxID=713604 RepID=A0A9R0UB84_AMYMS|nr:hypothetical protein [Amycolatopsis mediterranei]AEK44546.1 hypothetical protein RAM_30355 [Amycolatopsis mediterranei S699]AFO79373.1 hypothetical protein AMES_5837 [Amycolatopsis mediterranei S699]AGT86501.1 hypothetical protein B737_5837 [Amycolatopsis mediterranei RB]